MSPAHVLEPTYKAIKSRLMEGVWRPGMRLEANRIADDLGVSATPVRDSLNRLTGEDMVAFRAGEGFHVPRLSEQDFRDLVSTALETLLWCVGQEPHQPAAPAEPAANDAVDRAAGPAERAAHLFRALAARSGNREAVRVIISLNDRLHAFRRHEPVVLPGWEADLDRIEHAAARGESLRGLLRVYGERRGEVASDFLRLLGTDGG